MISQSSVGTTNLIIGIIVAILVALILLGGIKRIGQVAERLVPFMAFIYIFFALGVVVLNIDQLPAVFGSIINGAFHPASVTGGIVGSFFMSMKKVYQEEFFLMKQVLVQVRSPMHVLIRRNRSSRDFWNF